MPVEPQTQRHDEEQEFFALAERLRTATDSKEVDRLGDELGRRIFG